MAGTSYQAEVRIRIIGEDYVSGPANRVAFSLNRILQITAGIAITRAIFALGRAVSDLGRTAWEAAAEFQTLQIRYEGLIARQMAGLNTGEAFGDMLGENTEMAGWQIEQFQKLRDTYDSYVKEQQRLIDAGQDEGAYYDSVTKSIDNYATAIAQSIPGFEGMEDWQKKAALGALGMSEALEAAIGPANELIEWTKTMAVTTPFTAETLARANTLGMAMGFTTEETKRLTMATGNFTAGMGLSQDVIERIIYNFGQMIQQGKVTGTELRDLARGGFVPITDVLKQMQENLGETGKDFDQFRKDAAKGVYPVEEFFTAFMEIAERDFPNAMERMSRTWEGVTSNIHDFIGVVLGAEVLGPLLDRIAARLDDALKRMMSPEIRGGFSDLGETIADTYDKIANKVPDVIGSFIELGNTLGLGLGFGGAKRAIEGLGDALVWILDRVEGATNLFNTLLTPAVETFTKSIENASGILDPFLDPIKEFSDEHGDKFVDVLDRTVELFLLIGGAAAGLKIAGIAIKGIGFVLGKLSWPILIITTLISAFSLAWENNWFGIRDKLTEVWEGTIKPALEDLQYWFENELPATLAEFWGEIEPVLNDLKEWFLNELPAAIEGLWNALTGKANTAKENVTGAFGEIIDKIEEIRSTVTTFVDTAIAPFEEGWDNLVEIVGNAKDKIDEVGAFLDGTFGKTLEIFGSLIHSSLVVPFTMVGAVFSTIWQNIQMVAGILGQALGAALSVVGSIITEIVLPNLQALYNIFMNNIVPVFQTVIEVIQRNIETVTNFASGIIENLVMPIIEKLFDFFANHIIPMFQALWSVIAAVAAKISEFAVAFIQNVLLPAFEKVREVVSTVAGAFIEFVRGVLEKYVIPILSTVRDWLADKIEKAISVVHGILKAAFIPAFEFLGQVIDDVVIPALEWLKDHVLEPLLGVIDAVGGAVDKATGFFSDLATKIKNIKLPKWLEPGSPTPFEMGLTGINEQLEDFRSLINYVARDVNKIPSIDQGFGKMSGATAGAYGGSNIGQINFTIYGTGDADAVADQIILKLKQMGLKT